MQKSVRICTRKHRRSASPVVIQGDTFVAASRTRLVSPWWRERRMWRHKAWNGCPNDSANDLNDSWNRTGATNGSNDMLWQLFYQNSAADISNLSFMPNLHSGIPDNLRHNQNLENILSEFPWTRAGTKHPEAVNKQKNKRTNERTNEHLGWSMYGLNVPPE